MAADRPHATFEPVARLGPGQLRKPGAAGRGLLEGLQQSGKTRIGAGQRGDRKTGFDSPLRRLVQRRAGQEQDQALRG